MKKNTIKPSTCASTKLKKKKLHNAAIVSTLVLSAWSSAALAAPIFSSISFDNVSNVISIKGTGLCKTANCSPIPTVTVSGGAASLTGFTQTQTELKLTWTPPFAGNFPVIVTNSGGSLSSTLTAGAVGPRGLQGISGVAGPTGLTGAAGTQGLPGSNGVSGGAGVAGPQGQAGPVGVAGLNGLDGAIGPAGAEGPQGLPGPDGAAGTPGAKGDAGPAGTGPVGTATGDMQWWNGTTWDRIPVGLNNTTLKNCDGIPTWVADHCAFQIGDRGPAGGWVFYITDNGQHGLEAAPADLPPAPWGCFGTTVGATGNAIGDGQTNTFKIIAACSTGTAAYNAAHYSANGLGGWYLPTFSELIMMWTNIGQAALAPLTNVAGFKPFAQYWSSTEAYAPYAYVRLFEIDQSQGIQMDGKYIIKNVRPVRAF